MTAGWMCDLGDDLSHKRAIAQPCPYCCAQPNQSCRGPGQKPLPGKLIHIARRVKP
jgi:hypothetical protein